MDHLGLPPELFARVVYLLVEDVGLIKSAQYRLVSKMFAGEILQNIIALQHPKSFGALEDKAAKSTNGTRPIYGRTGCGTAVGRLVKPTVDNMRPLFKRYGAEILQHRLTGTQAFSSVMASWAKDLVKTLVDMEGSGSEEVRKAYTADICKSLIANIGPRWAPPATVLDRESFEKRLGLVKHGSYQETVARFPDCLLPFAAAAVSNQELFQAMVPPDFDYHRETYPFCSVLSAATATGKTGMAEYLLRNVKDQMDFPDRRNTERFAFTYDTARMLRQAVEMAIETSCTDIAEVVYDFVLRVQDPCIDKCMLEGRDDLMWLCIQRGKLRIAECVMSFGFKGQASRETTRFLFRLDSGSALRHMLKKGYFHPNKAIKCPGHYAYKTPLGMALEVYRKDIFKILLDFGADIDGAPDELGAAGVSLLWVAANRGDAARIGFLLEHGANPRSHEGWRRPLQVAQERGREEIIDLLANA
ncbi:hypothetical protein K458DRAFT_490066 [Lentithecium fluviatile CBS 122367]|uniref:Uncharacterized protein n=1 Tax=Lentithecium fluviatile CBS 122367 TaxID=1168545 RepID=A0A6G1IQ96_9PLEO|nr:hypothetical protein K458DRAFT_490066 [Lentithecium fluviatile CBS 122367]